MRAGIASMFVVAAALLLWLILIIGIHQIAVWAGL